MDGEEVKEEVKRRPRLVEVKMIRLVGKTALVEWNTKAGLQRVTIPFEKLLPDSRADVEVLEAGIPYGLPWEEIVTLEATPEAFATALRANGIWTKKDLEGNVRAVMGVLQSVYGLDLAHLLRAAGEHEKKLEVTNG